MLTPASLIAGFPSNILFLNTHLLSWVEKGTVGVMILAQEHNATTLLAPEPTTLDPGLSH